MAAVVKSFVISLSCFCRELDDNYLTNIPVAIVKLSGLEDL